MNVPLLRQIQATITKNPTQFDMQDFNCGSTACIGGWAILLSQNKRHPDEALSTVPYGGFEAAAKEALDLTNKQVEELCYVKDTLNYPNLWKASYGDEAIAKLAVADAVRFIDDFIARHSTPE